jgi:PAS domain S-box-containing protein
LTTSSLAKSLKRIEARAETESDDAGRFYERALRRRAERANESIAARLHALMDVTPHAVLIIEGRTGAVKETNEVACELFGYSPQEFRKLTVEDLVASRIKSIHHAYRLGFLANVRKREMGYHPPISGIRKDGTEVEMAIGLTATAADDDVMVICTLRTRWVNDETSEESLRATMS